MSSARPEICLRARRRRHRPARRLRRHRRRRGPSAGSAAAATAAGAAPGADPAATAAPEPTAAPQRGGTLTWGWSLPSTWDPVTSAVGNDSHALTLVYEAVTEQTADGEAAPGLAESWEYNATGDEITFHLREGLTFSDGTPLDAEAVTHEPAARPRRRGLDGRRPARRRRGHRRRQPDRRAARPRPARLPDPAAAVGQDRHDRQPDRHRRRPRRARHEAGRRRAVRARRVRAGLARQPVEEPDVLERRAHLPRRVRAQADARTRPSPRPGCRPGSSTSSACPPRRSTPSRAPGSRC